ncbi:putative acyl-CoA synthetase YngI [Novosphingobium endophyticum]|uniref:Acyl-CoA synthetase YngI n=1 Tax=Novosphingobium endophyticum TaxID=1955250 RepID=A0A916TPP2_9SPHN|nr:class I adenylate-forming enzyme family protein [Novosphingobium endophyticum]GGB89651.1 putative acyl-CoA synthetase YngI [Novosphingobium endophyticum]
MSDPDIRHPLSPAASIVHGSPLDDEPGIGTLTIPGYAREVTSRFAEREALVLWAPDGDRISWTYAELWERSVEVAKALVAAGAGKDARIGILMTNRPEYLAAVFGIAMAGGVTVTLSTFSTAAELGYLLRSGAVSVLLYERQVLKKDFGAMLCELEPAISDAAAHQDLASASFPFLSRLVALEPVTRVSGPAAPDPPIVQKWANFLAAGATVPDAVVSARAASVHAADTGAIFFSSGTTDLPKGIVHAQRALALQWWRWPRIYAIDPVNFPVRAWTGNGFFWSGNISMVVGNALTTGGTIVLQPVFEADEALELMEKEQVSYPNGRPHQWARLQASPHWDAVDLSSLHYITYSEILMSHPTVRTDWKLCPAFGTTETLTICTAVGANVAPEVHKGSYGRPLPGNTLKIFDPDTGAAVPVGERGEIAIKGPTLMIGYVGKTIENTFDDEGFFCTGDGGYVDESGLLFWEGRLTEIIKTGGANVSPIEIDLALANFPGVKRSQTVGVPDALLGEMVVSCIIPHDGVDLSTDALMGFLKGQFASYKVPRALLFFSEEEMATTGSGKVKFRQLRDLAARRLRAEGVAG